MNLNWAVANYKPAWDRFWFANDSSYTLSILRILWGLVVFQKFCGTYGLYRLPYVRFLLPRHEFPRESYYPINPEGFDIPYPMLDWMPTPSFQTYQILEALCLWLGPLFALGLFFRFIGPLLFTVLAYMFFSSQFLFHHHSFQMVIVTGILAFSRCNRHLSLDSLIFKGETGSRVGLMMPRKMIQILIAAVYLFAFLSKLNHGWFTGWIFMVFQEVGSLRGLITPLILSVVSFQFLGLLTVFMEGFLTFGFWFKRLKFIALFMGIGFHIGIDMMMAVGSFSYQMMVLYVVFFEIGSTHKESDQVNLGGPLYAGAQKTEDGLDDLSRRSDYS